MPGRKVRMPFERQSVTHRFEIGKDHVTGYLTIGLLDDGRPSEVFLVVDREGSTVRGLCHTLAMTISIALQYGVTLDKIVRKYKGICFEPNGTTSNPKIRFCSSIADYVARYVEARWLTKDNMPGGPSLAIKGNIGDPEINLEGGGD